MRSDSKLVLIPSGNSAVKEYRVSPLKILVLASSLVLVLASLGFWGVNSLTVWINNSKVQNLSRTNAVLKQHIDVLNGRIDSLYAQMNIIHAKDDDIRLLMDLPELDEGVRDAGIGGAKTTIDLGYDLEEFFLDDDSRENLLASYEKIENIERQVKFELMSYATLSQLVRNKKDSLRYLPAIFPTEGHRITDGFGMRRHPITGRYTKHEGLDIAAKIGVPVYATADGVVQFTGRNGGYGKSIFINHKYGFQTRFAHLHRILVKKGQIIKRGDLIGEVGNSGRSTGPHLHYEVRYNRITMDPKDFFFDSRFLR